MKRTFVEKDWLARFLLITVILLLCNNNVFAIRPTFTSTFYEVSVKEDAQIGHVLLHSLEADTSNVTTKYSLVGEQSQDFSITPYGSLQVARPLDHEQKDHYELTIAGISVTYPYETAYSLVAIDIEDVPDNYPVFEKAMYTVWVKENQTIKETFFSVTATTKDSFPLKYEIIGGNKEGLFIINTTTGDLSLTKYLYYRNKNSYRLVVQASYVADNSLYQDVVISIAVTNTGTPVVFSEEQYSFNVSSSVMSSDIFGYVFGRPCNASVISSGIMYSIDNNNITIDPSTGALFFSHSLPIGTTTYAKVTAVSSTDEDTTQLTINVVTTPSFNLSKTQYKVDINDDITPGTHVVTIDGEDGDNFKIIAGNCGTFIINETSGEIRVISSSLKVSTYFLAVGVFRQGIVKTVWVNVSVKDVNNAPEFDRDAYRVSILENVTIGTTILTVYAEDNDAGIDGTVTFTSPDLPSSLHLSRNEGSITVTSSLDRETGSVINFTVIAQDGGNPSLSAKTLVIITLIDVNDNLPIFRDMEYWGNVEENAPPGTAIAQLNAYDLDVGKNSAIFYRLLGTIDALTYLYVSPQGRLFTQWPIDRERYDSFSVTVRAEDMFNSSLSSEATVYISILDKIDTRPVFLEQTYNVYLPQVPTSNTPITTVQAITQDNTANIAYTIVNGNDLFTIHPVTGVITTLTSLTDPSTHLLTVKANVGPMSNTATVKITINTTSPAPQLHPSKIYISTYFYLLPSVIHLGVLTTTGPRAQLRLLPSSFGSDKYFLLNETGIYMYNTAPSDTHVLNISMTTSTGQVWYDTVTIKANLIPYSLVLENVLSLTFPNLNMSHFLERFLNPLISHVSALASCFYNCVDVVSIQSTSKGSEVAFLVRQPDLISYLPRDALLHYLMSHDNQLENLLDWTVLLSDDPCSNSPCTNYQQCVASLTLSSTFHTITSTSHIFISHTFSHSFSCICPAGYDVTGNCSQEINECNSNPCQFGGTCIDLVNDYQCECPMYTSGKNCSTVCPSSSCEQAICSPNPCFNEGECDVQSGQLICQCPTGFTGPLCELTTSHLDGDGYILLPSIERRDFVEFEFSFASIEPNGVLAYNGQYGEGQDHIMIELVLGSVRITVRWGDWYNELFISSRSKLLSDGQWHKTIVQLSNKKLTVSVGNCETVNWTINGSEPYCISSVPVSTHSRTLNLQTPLYIGGLPSFLLPLTNQTILTRFTGCLADVKINHKLIDFAHVSHVGILIPGCSPKKGCGSGCSGCDGECVCLWNGTTCNKDNNALSFNEHSYLRLEPNELQQMQTLSLQFRTFQSYALLMKLGDEATIEVLYGTIIFRYIPPLSPLLTLTINSYANDGHWHNININFSLSFTQLSVDNERVSTYINRNISHAPSYITLGGVSTSNALYKRGLFGCMQAVEYNLQLLSQINHVDGYNVTNVGVVNGCDSGNACNDTSHQNICPTNSYCNNTWRGHVCSCHSNTVPVGTECKNPCHPNPCVGGTCIHNRYQNSGFICRCYAPYEGLLCDNNVNNDCATGYYRVSEKCRPCKCDYRGVSSHFCSNNGSCSCNTNLAVYSPSGDVGCKLCDCNPFGSLTVRECDGSTGQCLCKLGVGGHQCNTCLTGYAGFGSDGCKNATTITGSFIFTNLFFQPAWIYTERLQTYIKTELLNLISKFGLSTTQELSFTISNSSDLSSVEYTLSSYFPYNNVILSSPSVHMLASIMQTIVNNGRLGYYKISPTSHMLYGLCTSNNPCDPLAQCDLSSTIPKSIICSNCPTGTYLDGIICRSLVPQNCSGRDLDRDGIPDSCDSCPYWFNPRQNVTNQCMINVGNGVCPNEFVEKIIWSPTESGQVDRKSCPESLAGIATRLCNKNGKWEEPNLTNCTSIVGQRLTIILEEIRMQTPTSPEKILDITLETLVLISSPNLYSGDLRAAILLMENILTLPLYQSSFKPLVDIFGQLSSSNHSEEWLKLGDDGVNDLLELIERFGPLAALSLSNGEKVVVNGTLSNMLVLKELVRDFNGLIYTVVTSSNDNKTIVSIPDNIIESSWNTLLTVAMTHLPTLSFSLPYPSPNITIGAPVWAIQLQENGRNVSQLNKPINITFPHPMEINAERMDTVCVTWNKEIQTWENDGCVIVEVTSLYSVCSCSHLSVFTLLLNTSEEVNVTREPEVHFYQSKKIALVYYVAVVLTIVFLLILIVVIIIKKWYNVDRRGDSFVEVWIQLLLSLLLLYTVFIAADWTANNVLCTIIGFLLQYLSLAVFCFFIFGIFAAITSLKWENYTCIIKFILSGLAWVCPLLFTGFSAVIAILTQPSLPEGYGYPDYCWITPSLSPLLYLPFVFFAICFICLLCYTLLTINKKAEDTTNTSFKKHKLNAVKQLVLFLTALLFFFAFNWPTIGLMIYSKTFSTLWQWLFGGISIITIIISLIVLPFLFCSDKVKQFFVYKFHLKQGFQKRLQDTARTDMRNPMMNSRQRSSLPSLPPEEPEYQTIDPNSPSTNPCNEYLQCCLQAERDEEVSQGTESEREVELEIIQSPVHENQGIEEEEQDQPWFALDDDDDGPCSPSNQPFFPAVGNTLPSQINDVDDDNESRVIDVLYQRSRNCLQVLPPPLYAEIGDVCSNEQTHQYARPLTPPWYKSIESDCGTPQGQPLYPSTPMLNKYLPKTRPLPLPPSLEGLPLPVSPQEPNPSRHDEIPDDKVYAKIRKNSNSSSVTSENPRRTPIQSVQSVGSLTRMNTSEGMTTSPIDRSFSMSKCNESQHSPHRQSNTKSQSSHQQPKPPPLNRRLSYQMTQQDTSVSSQLINHPLREQVVQLQNGSQTLQSLV